jgi:hypothetical protein
MEVPAQTRPIPSAAPDPLVAHTLGALPYADV